MSKLTISSKSGLRGVKIIGCFVLLIAIFFGFLIYWQDGSLSFSYWISTFLSTYFFWGMFASTEVSADKIVKKRGWVFPHFRSEYHQFRKIKLETKYIYNEGSGSHSYYAFYVGIVNGPFNDVVDLSWGFADSESGAAYVAFTKQLQALTGLSVEVTDNFHSQFINTFGHEFTLAPQSK